MPPSPARNLCRSACSCRFPSGSIQFAVEMAFLTAGIALLILGSRVGSNCNESVSSVNNKTVVASCKYLAAKSR